MKEKNRNIKWVLQFFETDCYNPSRGNWTTLSYGENNKFGFSHKQKAVEFANKENKSIDHELRMNVYGGRRIRVRGISN